MDAAFGGFDVLDLAFKTTISRTCPSMRFTPSSFAFAANAIENTDNSNEMPVAPVGGKHKGRARPRRLRLDAVHRAFSQRRTCAPLLVSGKRMQCSFRLNHDRSSPSASIRRKPVRSTSRMAASPVGCSPSNAN